MPFYSARGARDPDRPHARHPARSGVFPQSWMRGDTDHLVPCKKNPAEITLHPLDPTLKPRAFPSRGEPRWRAANRRMDRHARPHERGDRNLSCRTRSLRVRLGSDHGRADNRDAIRPVICVVGTKARGLGRQAHGGREPGGIGRSSTRWSAKPRWALAKPVPALVRAGTTKWAPARTSWGPHEGG